MVDWDDLDFAYQPTWFRKTITKWAEHWMPRYVDLITTHNNSIKDYAEKMEVKKVKIVPQGIDTKVFILIQVWYTYESNHTEKGNRF